MTTRYQLLSDHKCHESFRVLCKRLYVYQCATAFLFNSKIEFAMGNDAYTNVLTHSLSTCDRCRVFYDDMNGARWKPSAQKSSCKRFGSTLLCFLHAEFHLKNFSDHFYFQSDISYISKWRRKKNERINLKGTSSWLSSRSCRWHKISIETVACRKKTRILMREWGFAYQLVYNFRVNLKFLIRRITRTASRK